MPKQKKIEPESLTSLDKETAAQLAKTKAKALFFQRLTQLTPEAAQELASWSGTELYFEAPIA
jgi:hypothetical protein